jgi:hypothetical protein
MASEPSNNLPLFYKDLMPLNTRDHGSWRSKSVDTAEWLADQHAVPITVDEFALAQRDYPIVFSAGENPVPLALMGLNEGINVFVDAKGKFTSDVYVPAYIRRYPFLLAKLQPDSDNMSLCFDPTSPVLGEYKQGEVLFENAQPSEFVKGVMQFCENFEMAGQRTQAFVAELKEHDLLMEGEVAIQRTEAEESAQPYVYRGFKMINQEKFREISGEQLEKWNKSGLLMLVYAHLLSLDLMRTIFAMQTAQGKGPGADEKKPKKSKK